MPCRELGWTICDMRVDRKKRKREFVTINFSSPIMVSTRVRRKRGRMRVIKVIVDEMPEMCRDCIFFDIRGKYHDIIYCVAGEFRTTPTKRIPGGCPLVLETNAGEALSGTEGGEG